MSYPNSDAGIPVLTEIIPAPPAETAHADDALPSVQAPTPSESEQWAEMEQAVRAAVLDQVLSRIDLVLEQRVRDSLADVLQTAVDGLATEIRSGLRQSLRDVVTRAVSDEISKLRATTK